MPPQKSVKGRRAKKERVDSSWGGQGVRRRVGGLHTQSEPGKVTRSPPGRGNSMGEGRQTTSKPGML